MKSNYKLKLISALVVLGVSVVNAKALQPTLTPTTITTENSDNWAMVQNENGIKVYFSEYKLDERSYLKIRFENTTSQIINFSWSLMKGSESIIKESTSKISALTSVIINDDSMLIPLNDGDAYADFLFNIQVK